MFKQNISNTNCIVRSYLGGVLGVFTLVYFLVMPSWAGMLLGMVALTLIITGSVRYCPIHQAMSKAGGSVRDAHVSKRSAAH